VRAGLLALLTVLISVGGHALAGGPVHVSLPLMLGGAALGGMCVAAADVRRSFPEILAVVLLAQPPLHLLASIGAQHGSGATPTGHVSATMVLAHLAAALLASVLLADAERALWTLAGLFRLAPIPQTVPLQPLVPPRLPVSDGDATPLGAVRLADSVCRRGPPMVLGAH
jgi:hypothetical protein